MLNLKLRKGIINSFTSFHSLHKYIVHVDGTLTIQRTRQRSGWAFSWLFEFFVPFAWGTRSWGTAQSGQMDHSGLKKWRKYEIVVYYYSSTESDF